MNFAVSRTKGKTDAFDLGDTRVGATLDPVPTFVNGRLEKEKMKPNNPAYAGENVLYRRILGPEVFSTDWNHDDHVVIGPGLPLELAQEAKSDIGEIPALFLAK